MRYLNILDCDIADGAGIRVALFVSGCSHKCAGCHNPESWDCNAGKIFTFETMQKLIKLIDRPYIDGLTLSGGDPLFEKNRDAVLEICKTLKNIFPDRDIWLYTGYNYEEIKDLDILNYVDYLVDGKFVEKLRDITLAFRGSSNQRIIDLKESRKQNKIIIFKE